MTDTLFARRLRAFRGSAGGHGRLTQEQLAERLGVSVDAIGKYERSLSYIRGDLEHRLSEKLGWSREDVLACREDWEGRARQNGSRYRVMDNAAPDAIFGGSLEAAVAAAFDFVTGRLEVLPVELDAERDTFTDSHMNFPENWVMILTGDAIAGMWTLPFLLDEDVERFRRGALLEATLTTGRLRRPLLPGRYYGYCPGLYVAPGQEAVSHLLLQSFVDFLEGMAQRGVVLDGIGTISVSAAGAQLCRDLGMTRFCDHALGERYGCWELPGAAIPGSIFGRRSRLLRRVYSEAFGPPASRASSRA